MSNETDAQRNGMTDAEWAALSPAAQKWRTEHPRPAHDEHAHAAPQAPGAAVDLDRPGHAPEEAAPSGVLPAATPGLSPAGQGAQVILTGDAQAAARGGLHGDIVKNTAARDEAIAAGHVIEGTTAAAAVEATTLGADEGRAGMEHYVDPAETKRRADVDSADDRLARARAAEKAKRA